MLPTLLSLLASAEAYTMAGFGMPLVGGSFAGNAEVGPLGLPYNPAAAWVPRASGTLDLGSIYAGLYYKMDAWDEASDPGGTWSIPIPYLGLTAPAGPVGIGVSVFVPYARVGGRDPEGPQRYSTIEGTFMVIEEDISVAWAASANFTLGASLRIGQFQQGSTRSLDTGAILHSMLGPDAGVPLQDPFLEGSQTLVGLNALMVGWALGARWHTDAGFGAQVAYRPRWVAHITNGLVEVHPSRDLNLTIEGDVEAWITFPTNVFLSGTIPVGPVTFVPEVAWLRWSESAENTSLVHDFRITSDDPFFDKLLESYGVSEAEFLEKGEPMVQDLAFTDAVNFGLVTRIAVSDAIEARVGAVHQPGVVPDPVVHPGNLDFTATDLKLGLRVSPNERIQLGGSFDYLWTPDRRIDDSVMSLTNPQSSGRVFPSGNGDYEIDLMRIGVTAAYSL